MEEVMLQELPHFAREVLARISKSPHGRALIIFLQGELGSGKTTFMQAFAKELGIEETVQSPTFVLMRAYDISYGPFSRLVHIDAYRLDEPAQFQALKPETFLTDPHAIVCIEWPERLEGALPKPDLALKFSHGEEKERARTIDIGT